MTIDLTWMVGGIFPESAMANSSMIRIRSATEADASALLAIYRPIVEETAISFETATPTEADFAGRIAKAIPDYQWLVAEQEGRCLGYSYGSAHRDRPAYRWSAEVSAYVHASHRGRGVGRRLYEHLLDDLARKGICNVYAGVTLPNEASIALHCSAGFEPIGTFKAVGRKFRQWHDVAWFQRALRVAPLSE